MNLEERVVHLQRMLEKAVQEGASHADIAMYESTIAELLRINDWMLQQTKENNKVFFEDDGSKYMLFKNTTGLDFKYFGMKIKIVHKEKVVDVCEVAVANWKAGKWSRLYFETTLREGNVISIDANSVEYQVASGRTHR